MPVLWDSASGGNDHWYEAVYVAGQINWEDANSAAILAGGYLVSIHSNAENEFVSNLITDSKYWYIDDYSNAEGPWLGGYQPEGSSEPDGGWTWISGESFSYSYWSDGEPNNFVPIYGEDRTVFFKTYETYGYKWNDVHHLAQQYGYVVEYNSNPIPEPRFSTIVRTKYGKIEGFLDVNDTLAWKGIPYAKPPVGRLRWKAPRDPDRWHGILETKEFCDECAQMGQDLITGEHTEPIGSEDCLYLNIWRPNTRERNLPVYFWIHGGSNNYGTAKYYGGSAIASRSNVVVVTIQYRLGPFGWLTHPALRKGRKWTALNDSGNFGTLDTIKALKWVRKNIRAFGGNPHNVLVAGESAGSHNVMNFVISPLAKGLFHKALSQSGGMKTYTVEAGDARAECLIVSLLAGSGYPSDVEGYLREKTTEELIYGYWFADWTDWGGVVPSSSAHQDGFVIPDGGVIPTIESGKYNKVPIILGSNEDEMKFYLPVFGPLIEGFPNVPSSPYTWGNLFDVLDGYLDLTLDEVLPTDDDKALYLACGEFGSLNWRYNFVDAIARPLKEHQNKVYAYLFKWDGVEGSDYDFILGAAHATEIPFFFGGDTDIYGGFAFSPGDDTPGRQALSEAMMKYVAKFARSGNPNARGLPRWKQWSNREGKPKAIIFDATETDTDIYMIDEEITAEDVEAKGWELYYSLPEEVRDLLGWFVWY